MHRPDVGKPAAGSDHGERGARFPAKEEQAGVTSCRLLALLRLAVEIVEHDLALADVIDHAIQRLHRRHAQLPRTRDHRRHGRRGRPDRPVDPAAHSSDQHPGDGVRSV